MKEKINILVCTHKADSHTRNSGIYKAIHAGKALHQEIELGYLNDNIGDNISYKNPNYCELTALYWGWKNIKDVEYCGLNHYRRYFNTNINENNIDTIIEGYDMIVTKSNPMFSKRERANNLIKITTLEDYYLFVDTLFYLYPDSKDAFIEYFYNSKVSYPYQMFIAKKELYDEYCEFLFSILFELEKRVKNHEYTRLKRTLGYIGEWMLGLFIFHKKLKVKSIPVLFISNEPSNHTSLKISRHIVFSNIKLYVRKVCTSIIDLTYKKPKNIIVPDMVKVGLANDGITLRSLNE